MKDLRWGVIILNNNDDKVYHHLIEELRQISGAENVMNRKNNEDIWLEYELYSDRQYVIEAMFTPEEIKYLEKHYKNTFYLF